MNSRLLGEFRRTLRRILASRRAYGSVAVGAVSSVGNLALTVSISRTAPIAEVGEYAVAFAFYVFLVGVVRSAVSEPLLASDPSLESIRASMRRTSLLAILLGPPTVAVGALVGNPYVAIVGLTLHGLAAYEYCRIVNLALLRPRRALAQEVCWTSLSLCGAGLVLSLIHI